jgi:biopolymer transport protein ExbD/biopolymer transport protein TolR
VKAQSKQVFNDINITPLTDIFLVLLIIMMVVAPLLEYKQLNLAVLPSGESEQTPGEAPKSVKVIIDASGAFTVDGTPVSAADLEGLIREESVKKPDGLIVETHPDAPFEAMATALDATEGAGITEVATIETDTAAPETPAAKPAEKAKK